MRTLLFGVVLILLSSFVGGQHTYIDLPPGATTFSGSLASGQVLFYRFNGFTPGSCFSLPESASFDVLYGHFNETDGIVTTADFTLSGKVDSNGDVKVGVTGWNDNKFVGAHTRSGTFNLVLTAPGITNDGNNNFGSSSVVPAGQVSFASDLYEVFGSCGAPHDVDFITFNLPVGACWTTQITRSFDEIFGLFAPNGTLLKTADSSLNGFVDETGQVHIAISGWNDNKFVGTHSHDGEYNLTINVQTYPEQVDNTFETRVTLAPGVTTYAGDLWAVTGSCSLGDVDFVTFRLTPGVCAQTSITRGFDEIFGLFDDNGVLIKTADSQITTNVSPSGNLNLALSGWNDNTFKGDHTRSGTYSLTINTFPLASDGNNDFEHAHVIDGSVERSFISELEAVSTPCEASGDVDFVTFTNLPSGHCFHTLVSRSFDEILGWFDSEGNILDVDDVMVSGKVPSNGVVTVAISGWNDNTFIGSHSRSGNYNLTLVTVSPTSQDGNDNFESRTLLANGLNSVSSDLYDISPPPCDTVSDVDFWEFSLTPGACFSTSMSSNFDDMVGHFDSQGNLVEYRDSGAITGVVPSNGKLVLAVTGFNDRNYVGAHSRSGDYTLSVEIITAQTDSSESFDQAVFQFGSTVNGNLYAASSCGGGDVDYWILLTTAGSCFYTNKTTSFNDYLGAFTSSGTLIDKDENEVSGIAPADGVVVLAVTGSPDTNFEKEHTQSGTYSIHMNIETVTPDNDNTFASRKTVPFESLPLAGSLSSYVHCESDGDVDFFTITNLSPGSCFQTQITRDFDEIWGWYDDQGNLLDTDDTGFTSIVPASGRVNFALSGWNDNQFNGDHQRTGTYSVNLILTKNEVVEDGNDSFETAVVVPEGQLTYSGDLFSFVDVTPCTGDSRSSDVDYVRFTVEPGCTVTADVESGFDDYFGYFNEVGDLVDSVDTGSLTFEAGDSGAVVIGVTAWADTSFTGAHSGSGNYTVSLVLDCGNAPDGFNRVKGGALQVTSTMSPGDVDFWTFEGLPAGACFRTSMTRDFDELLGWFNDDGVIIMTDDSQITGFVSELGQVNIGVTGWNDAEFIGDHTRSGTYTLSLTVTQNQPPPPSDGNDHFSERVTVSNFHVSGSIWATIDQTPCPDDHNTVNDVDYYTFDSLTVGYCATTRMEENFDSALGLLNDVGTLTAWEDYTLNVIVPSSGHLNIAVTGYPDRELTGNHQKNGNYTLYIDLTHNEPAPASDGNDQFNTPTVLPFDQMEVSGNIWSLTDHTPCPGDFVAQADVDFYRFGPLTPGHCFQTHMERDFDEILGWYSSDGTLLAVEDNQITGHVPENGLVYIAVSGWRDLEFIGDHQKNGVYTLSLTTSVNEPPPASDGNDKFEDSTWLEMGETSVSDTIWATIDQTPCPDDHNTVNDVDFWTFQGLQAGSCFETIMDRDFDEYLGWFDDSGMLLEGQDYRVIGRIPENGRVNIAVSGWYDAQFNGTHTRNGEYSLRLSVTRNDEPGERVDNDFATRVVLPEGQRVVSGDIWVVRDRTPCPDDTVYNDVDFFTFTGLPAGTCFRTSNDRDFDEIVGWYGNDGLQKSWSDNDIWGVVPENGEVHLAMSGWADYTFMGHHSIGGRYSLEIILDSTCGGFGGSSSGMNEWCSSNCAGKVCGDNGCGLGGTCGSCSTGEFCLVDGSCSATCDSSCTVDQQCGSDGCGGNCGTCGGSQDVCSGGQCVCIGNCNGRVCGDDGCGGSCGTCPGEQEQCFDGVCACVPACDDAECGWDGCGGICGVCGPYYACGEEGMCVRDSLTQPSCDDYFGYPHHEVSLTLLKEVNKLLKAEIRATIENLEDMREALLEYDPDTQVLDLASLIDKLHLFCSGPYKDDTCLSLSEIEFVESAFLHAIHVVTTDPHTECAGRVCGTTSYGGSCGSCPTGQHCTEDGQCVCSYDCTGRECGMAVQEEGTSLALCPESSCGTCANRYECNMDEYACVKVPHPPVTIHVMDSETGQSLNVNGMVEINSEELMYMEAMSFSANGSAMATWVPPDHEGIFNFSVSAVGYHSVFDERSVVFETNLLEFFLERTTFSLFIIDSSTNQLVESSCSYSWMVDSHMSNSDLSTPPNPATITVPDNGFGLYSFQVDCFGYQSTELMMEVMEQTTQVMVMVQRNPVSVAIVNCESSEMLGVTSSISISSPGNDYSVTLDLEAFSTVMWTPPFSGSFDFATSGLGYVSSGENRQVDLGLNELIFCLERSTFMVQVVDSSDDQLVSESCVVEWMAPGAQQMSAAMVTPPNPFTLSVPDNGYGEWEFNANCNGYQMASMTAMVDVDTMMVTIMTLRNPVLLTVNDCESGQALSVMSMIEITGPNDYSLNIEVSSNSSNVEWMVMTYGDYTFHYSAEGYVSMSETVSVSSETSMQSVCLNRMTVEVQVMDASSQEFVQSFCSVTIQRVGSDETDSVLTPPNPFVWTLPDYPFGEWNFITSCEGYNGEVDTFEISQETLLVTILVEMSTSSFTVEVVEAGTNNLVQSECSVSWSNGEMMSSQTTPPNPFAFTLVQGAFGEYTFTTNCMGFDEKVEMVQVDDATQLITIVVEMSVSTFSVQVMEAGTTNLVEAECSVSWSMVDSEVYSQTTPPNPFGWTVHQSLLGEYVFTVSCVGYDVAMQTEMVSMESLTITLFVRPEVQLVCGDGLCTQGETYTNCKNDCAGVLLEFEGADITGPVNSVVLNYYSENPRVNSEMGPVHSGASPVDTLVASDSSNVILKNNVPFNTVLYIEAIADGKITFYWTIDSSLLNPTSNVLRLRAHLSSELTPENLNYRFVNTWRPNDALPEPYAPTDLNLHLFHPDGSLDVNNNMLIDNDGFLVGTAVVDSKQSGGPATMDMDVKAGQVIGVWNSKPPRDPITSPLQQSRHLVDSGSFIVVYGKTTDAPEGKQLGEVLLSHVPATGNSFDLWYAMQFSVENPGQSQATITQMTDLENAQINSNNDMIFDCKLYPHCSSFVVPYSDSSKK